MSGSSAFNAPSTSSEISSIVSRDTRHIVPASDAGWHRVVIRRLNHLTRLAIGWDGYKGQPVAFDNANFALRLLESVCDSNTTCPQLVPGPSGDLQIEWHSKGIDIEVRVHEPNKVTAWRCSDSTDLDGEEIKLRNDFTVVAQWVREMTEQLCASESAAA